MVIIHSSMFSLFHIIANVSIIDIKLGGSILTKSNLPSLGLFYKLGSYYQLPGSILPHPHSPTLPHPHSPSPAGLMAPA